MPFKKLICHTHLSILRAGNVKVRADSKSRICHFYPVGKAANVICGGRVLNENVIRGGSRSVRFVPWDCRGCAQAVSGEAGVIAGEMAQTRGATAADIKYKIRNLEMFKIGRLFTEDFF